jgi:hypothetical protein
MSLQTELNRADPNRLPDLLRAAAIGNVLKQLAGPAAIEETVAVNANVGVLQNRALSILAVTPTAGAVSGPVTLVSASIAPVTKTASIALDQKTLTFFATDAVTAAKVTYIPAPPGLELTLAGTFEGL